MVAMLVDKSKSGRNRSNLGIIALNEKRAKAAETKTDPKTNLCICSILSNQDV